jgi:hypothetical protein
MVFAKFLSLLDAQLELLLAPEEFHRTGNGLFVRCKDEVIHLIQIQKHSKEPTCCVNIGVHFSFSPTLGTSQLPDLNTIEIPDCDIKIRLTPSESQADYWWPINDSSTSEIISLVSHKGLLIFDAYQLDKLALLSPAHLSDDLPSELKSMTRVLAVLLLARLNVYLGRRLEAVDFANLGLKVAGMAVGPKVAFKKILATQE